MRINHDNINRGGYNPPRTISSNDEKIFIAIPTYDGDVSYQCTGNLVKTVSLFQKHGISCDVRFASHLIIQVARNALVDEFLKSDCTHILFIDSDQGWQPEKILEMYKMDQEFIAGAIRYKQDDESYPLILDTEKDGQLKYGPFNLVKAFRIGVALALVKRIVFDKIDSYHILPKSNKYGKEYFAFYIKGFEYQGEDNDFCDKLRKSKVNLWIYPNIETKHIGKKEFTANFDTYLRKLPGGDLNTTESSSLTELTKKIKSGIQNSKESKNV